MRDIITEIWSTTRRNKLRTMLTGFAVAWGIFMLIFLLGAGNGLIHAMEHNSDRFLDNSMMVFCGQTSKPFDGLKEGRFIQLNQKDIDATHDDFKDHIVTTGAELEQGGNIVSLNGEYISAGLSGVYPNEAEINKREILYGRFINQIDNEQQRKVLVISSEHAKQLAPANPAGLIGQYVNVGNFVFQVVGIYKTDESRSSNSVYSAFNTIRTMYARGDKADNIMFSFQGLKTQQANEQFEHTYRTRLNANHRAAPDDEESIWIWNRFTQALQMNTGMSMLRTALWVIGLFTLLSGIVGVSNIMLITVKERTREFGIRKAIGAKPWSILRLIIIESIIITTFFGYIGMVLGIAANQYMNVSNTHSQVDIGVGKVMMFLDPTVGFDVCIEATVVMVLAGTLAGFVPARKASRIRPIEALRAE